MIIAVMSFSGTGVNYAIHANMGDGQVEYGLSYLCHGEALRAQSCSGKKLLRV